MSPHEPRSGMASSWTPRLKPVACQNRLVSSLGRASTPGVSDPYHRAHDFAPSSDVSRGVSVSRSLEPTTLTHEFIPSIPIPLLATAALGASPRRVARIVRNHGDARECGLV